MFNYLRIEIPVNSSDEEIRQLASRNPNNGSYATYICRNCGVYKASQQGDYRTAKIVDICAICFDSCSKSRRD